MSTDVPETIHEVHVIELRMMRALGRAAGTVYLADLAFRRLVEVFGDDFQVGCMRGPVAAEHVRSLWVGRGARSVRREVGCLRAAWARAEISPNPWVKLSRIHVDPVELRIVTLDEEGDLRRFAGSELSLWLAVLFETGARAGEASGIRAVDVLQERPAIAIASRPGARTKTRTSRMAAIGRGTWGRLKVITLGGYAPWGPGSPRRILGRMRDRLGRLCISLAMRRVRPQDIRRTVGTRLALAGVSAGIAARVLGHRSAVTTLEFYTRVLEEDVADAVARTWLTA